MSPGEVDVYSLASGMEAVQQQLKSMAARLSVVEQQQQRAGDDTHNSVPVVNGSVAVAQHATTSNSESSSSDGHQTTSSDSSDVEIDNDTAGWATVAGRNLPPRPPRPPRQKPTVRIKGTRSDGGLKSVPRTSILSAYVGRLHPDTTAEDLTKYLQAEGIKGVACRKLMSKDGRTFKAAAFYVTCCTESHDKFYDETCWPDGVELRDWIYHSK